MLSVIKTKNHQEAPGSSPLPQGGSMQLLFGIFAAVCASSSTLYPPTIPAQRGNTQGASFVPSSITEEATPQEKAVPTPKNAGKKTPEPSKPIPPNTAANPLKKQLKKGQIFYRLDDRINGKLSCDKWTLSPTNKEDPNQGTLTLQYKLTDRTVIFTYDYKAILGDPWTFQINGKENGRVEKIKGGVNYIQTLQCQETYELGEVRKTDFDLGSGVWYLNKASCEKAKKASAAKSPGSC
jgi:hypothetical protein